MGSKKKPFYRIVAADSHDRRDGSFIELVGTYSPLEDSKININEEVALKWFPVILKPEINFLLAY